MVRAIDKVVAQVSKPAVSQGFQPADAAKSNMHFTADALPIWKSAIQQVWKPALRWSVALAISMIGPAVASNLHWESGPGYRTAALSVAKEGRIGFTRVPGSVSGILFTNFLSTESGVRTQLRLAGSGVAAGDVDADGWCDLYFCAMEGGNRLYRNRGGWRFEDITDEAGVRCAGQYSTGAALADVDADEDLDLLVNSIGGGTRLFLNDGQGHFRETTNCGLLTKYGPTTMAFGDVDGNGTLDLYVTNNNSPTALGDEPNTRFTLQAVEGKLVILAVDGKPVAGTDLAGRYDVNPFDNSIREYGEPDILYLNDGAGHFSPVSWTNGDFLDEEGATLTAPPRDLGLSVMVRDINEDGAPDIYVCNDLFTPDRIWINDGRGRFQAASRTAIRSSSAFSMGIDFADIDRDGHDDFIVVDMLSQDHRQRIVQAAHMTPVTIRAGEKNERMQVKRNVLHLNRGDGTYAEIAQLSGLEASAWSWATLFLDVDLDGYEDVLVAPGYDRDSMNGDVDAEIELRRAKGKLSSDEIRKLGLLFPRIPSPIVAFRNLGDLRFKEAGREWGFDWVGVNQGIGCADLDNDGDLDVIVNNLHDEAGVYRNEGTKPRVAVRLKGTGANTRGIGSKIWLYGGGVPVQSQEMICGGRYLSSDDAIRVFATGTLSNEMTIEVNWRSGRQSVVKAVRANQVYEIDESVAALVRARADSTAGEPQSNTGNKESAHAVPEVQSSKFKVQTASSVVSSQLSAAQNDQAASPSTDRGPRTTDPVLLATRHPPPVPQPLFEDVSHLLKHVHHEETYDDFERQPLLPHKLSQLGPGVSWSDVDGDGREDLLVGSGRGGQLEIFLNHGKEFQRLPMGALLGRAADDHTTVLGWGGAEGPTGFVVGQANYERVGTNGVKRYEMWAGGIRAKEVLGTGISSAGPLAMGDMDGDGNLELFVGGRVRAGRWPEAASSKLYRLIGGRYVLDEANRRVFEQVGMVTGAAWSDLDGDGYSELILACEWGPLRLFRSDQGKLTEWNPPVSGPTLNSQLSTLNSMTGWWNGVAAGDFDGDGRMDLAASNWGSNSKYEKGRTEGHPLRIYYGDWNADGVVEVMEGYYERQMKKVVPWRGLNGVARGIPWVRERYATHAAYSEAGVEEILGNRAKEAKVWTAAWLETTVFLNRGGRFAAVVLPGEAQFSPAFGVSVGDADGDGKEDIFLSQNFFGVDEETTRYDAGRGVWLRGDGQGQFEALRGQVSGVMVYGEGRGSALCDYDGDGRVDLVVGQNGAETKLYHNLAAKPGLRVRLVGPPGNPTAIGAVVRLRFGERWGPAREIHAGSGYWSQDSAVQVLGTSGPPTKLWVRWPGGKIQLA
ncbi:MAG: FG-GAP-like repeat-containing protein, partial [Verrucomicrobiales bacterium]|nr:FG-GAP-like repeat-containing protein [Verrucomicrobiales bacterium]